MKEVHYYTRKGESYKWVPLSAKSIKAAREEVNALPDGNDMVEIGQNYMLRQPVRILFKRNRKGQWEKFGERWWEKISV